MHVKALAGGILWALLATAASPAAAKDAAHADCPRLHRNSAAGEPLRVRDRQLHEQRLRLRRPLHADGVFYWGVGSRKSVGREAAGRGRRRREERLQEARAGDRRKPDRDAYDRQPDHRTVAEGATGKSYLVYPGVLGTHSDPDALRSRRRLSGRLREDGEGLALQVAAPRLPAGRPGHGRHREGVRAALRRRRRLVRNRQPHRRQPRRVDSFLRRAPGTDVRYADHRVREGHAAAAHPQARRHARWPHAVESRAVSRQRLAVGVPGVHRDRTLAGAAADPGSRARPPSFCGCGTSTRSSRS